MSGSASRPTSTPVADPAGWGAGLVSSVTRALVVAVARSWSHRTRARTLLPEVARLRGHDAGDGVLLRRRSRGDPVDGPAAGADAGLGPHVADRGQRASYGLQDGAVGCSRFSLDLSARPDAAQQPVVEEQPPVLGHRWLAVLLVEERPERQLQEAGMRQPQRRVGDVGLARRDLLPASRCPSAAGTTNRCASHAGSGVDPKAGSNRSVVSSWKRVDCSRSQAASSAVGSVSQASSAYGARVPSSTSAGIRAS